MQKAAQAYFQTQVSTTSQGELLLMLYDGAVKFLRQAQEKINEKDYAQKGILISKALDVIAELDGSLNVQKGGEIAQNLHNLYFYCNTRLLLANMNMDNALIDEVIKILSGLRSAYGEIIEKQTGVQTSASQQSAPAGKQTGPRAPLLLNKEDASQEQPAQSEQAPEPAAPGQHDRGESPLESLATQIARNPPRPAAQSAPAQGDAEQTTTRQPSADHAPPQTDASPQPGARAATDGTETGTPPDEEKPAPAKPAPNRGRLLAGASIYKKMANQS